jgi:hypothetical protein
MLRGTTLHGIGVHLDLGPEDVAMLVRFELSTGVVRGRNKWVVHTCADDNLDA